MTGGHFEEGAFFYMVSYSFQSRPGDPGGAASTHGLVYPADKTQYGQLVNDILHYVRSNGMGAPGYQVIQFFHIMPHTLYRDPVVLAQERAKENAERTDQLRKELSA
jgi:hypothetical protein